MPQLFRPSILCGWDPKPQQLDLYVEVAVSSQLLVSTNTIGRRSQGPGKIFPSVGISAGSGDHVEQLLVIKWCPPLTSFDGRSAETLREEIFASAGDLTRSISKAIS